MRVFFDALEDMVVAAAASVRPPERLTVSQAAEKYRFVNNPGSFVGPWRNALTQYLVEPQDTLTSTAYTGMVFVGPAQCGKTDMFINWQLYSVICDPADMMLIQTAQATARDFSIRRIDRLHRHSPDVGRRLVLRRNSDNTFDKRYQSGMILTLSWPTINELSGKPVPRLWATDYDRMTQDVDGEGNPFDLARKRATSFRSNGMTVAESSPGFPVTDPKWQRTSLHEAPPTTGILALYNRGDRRRWYWRCPFCNGAFEPGFNLLRWPDTKDILEAAEMATLACPRCDVDLTHDPGPGQPGKHELNHGGRWLRDGQRWLDDGTVEGDPRRSDIASFWMKGPAAAFTDWKSLVAKYLQAKEEYASTGSEEALKATINTDQGEPYTPVALASTRVPEDLKGRAKPLDKHRVPAGVRFLVACVDLQKNRFEVQIHGIGQAGDIWIIDRFPIIKSKRLDTDGERLWVNPGAYPEDWKLLIDEVLLKSYELADGSGRHMPIKLVMCDSQGRENFTTNAYNFYRFLRDGPEEGQKDLPENASWVPNLHRRFQLLRGSSRKDIPRVRLIYPDSERRDRHAGARGEIPVLEVNGDSLKDTLDKMLDRLDPGGGRITFPNWLDYNFYAELCVEIKDPVKGQWVNPRGYRNESWDLLVYCVAGCISKHIGLEHIDWSDPPSWADEWDVNDLVFSPKTGDIPFAAKRDASYDLGKLASLLA